MKNKIDLLFTLGRPFSPMYSAVMKIREKMYNTRIFRQHKLQVPVISVGNLVLGGSGKTPTVRHIADRLTQNGLHVAIVSRGYGGKANLKVNIVSDGKQIFLSAIEAGDEPRMLAELLPGVVVLTGSKRIHPCRYAIDKYNVDVIVLDDGFQHLSVSRDVDTVLFDASTLAGNSRVLPGGPLREPVSALNRCHGFLITSLTESNSERAEKFSNLLKEKFPDKPVFFSRLELEKVPISDENPMNGSTEDRFFAFCGIGNPSRFSLSLASLGITPCGFVAFSDHASYSQASLEKLQKEAVEAGANAFITTEKDYVKIKQLQPNFPVHVLKIRQNVEEAFDDYICSRLNDKVSR